MSRSALVVRASGPQEMPALACLWEELLAAYDPGPTPGTTGHLERARQRWVEAGDSSGLRTFVAWDGDTPVGMLVLRIEDNGIWDTPLAVVTLLHVSAKARHRGAGRLLLGEALATADRLGADQVGVDVHPHLREVNRFFAKLGFGPVMTRRMASTAALRRRLHPEKPARSVRGLRARATLRRRTTVDLSGGEPLGDADAEVPAPVKGGGTAASRAAASRLASAGPTR